VCKESGYGSRRLNAWERVFESLSEAEKHYERIIRDKTNLLTAFTEKVSGGWFQRLSVRFLLQKSA